MLHVTNVTLVTNVTPCNTRWYKPSVTSFWSYILPDFETQFLGKLKLTVFNLEQFEITNKFNLKQY